MSVAVNCPTPFLPITSLQLQHLQSLTRSFAQRRPIISSVFNNFRTLSVVMGGGTLSCQVFRGFRVGGFRSPLFSCRYKLFLLFRTICVAPRGVLQFDMPLRCTRTNVRLRRCFPVGKCEILTWRCPHSMLYIAIQCAETPFGERFGAIPPTPVD